MKSSTEMIDYYRESGQLIEIHGEGALHDVNERTLKAAQSVMNTDQSGALI